MQDGVGNGRCRAHKRTFCKTVFEEDMPGGFVLNHPFDMGNGIINKRNRKCFGRTTRWGDVRTRVGTRNACETFRSGQPASSI